MRLLYVVQRYGETIAGGAEQHCREMAERMARRGHHVEVATIFLESIFPGFVRMIGHTVVR